MGIKRLHVPLVDELARQLKPRLAGELFSRIHLAIADPVPVSSRECAVMADDFHDVVPHMGREHVGGDGGVAGVAEHLPNVVEEPSQHHLIIHAGPFGARRDLQGMVELADVTSVADVA